MSYCFRAVEERDFPLIERWLEQSYVQEFWDNSVDHRQDIQIFAQGRTVTSPYFGGCFSYWLGCLDDKPFSLIMTSNLNLEDESLPKTYRPHLLPEGKSCSLDFMIGDKAHLGKGLAAPTLKAFTEYFSRSVNPKVRSFMLDPVKDNLKAFKAYKRAGFQCVDSFTQEGGVFDQKEHFLMVKKVFPDPEVIPATKKDLPTFEALAPFYLYEMSPFVELDFLKDGQGAGDVFKLSCYFEDPKRHPFLIRVDGEVAGFALIHPFGLDENIDWCMGEFFILRKFQGTEVAEKVVEYLFEKFKGLWEITVPPENIRSKIFWKRVLPQKGKTLCRDSLEEVSFPSSKVPVWRMRFHCKA